MSTTDQAVRDEGRVVLTCKTCGREIVRPLLLPDEEVPSHLCEEHCIPCVRKLLNKPMVKRYGFRG